MDYQRILFKTIINIVLAALLSACGSADSDLTIGSLKTSPEPLRITGTPASTLFYDSVFTHEFGAAGGDGVYRYRYIQNPVDSRGEPLNEVENPVEMTIEVLDDAKPFFKLIALPVVPENTDDGFQNRKFNYQLELTDGVNTIKRDFEFTLKQNSMRIISLPAAQEGVVNNTAFSQLISRFNLGNSAVCKQVGEQTFEKRINLGKTVYPYTFQIFTEGRVATRTELKYRLKSGYNEQHLERTPQNINFLRPNVDYIDAVRTIIMEPGNNVCLGYIEFLDDNLIERDEEVRLEFFEVVGSPIDIDQAAGTVTLRDNELKPKYKTDNIVRNKGDKIVVSIKMVVPRNYPVSVAISVDQSETTADPADYLLEPSNGIVTISEGELEASYTLTLLDRPDANIDAVFEDKLIAIVTDIDQIIDVEPYTVEINQWPIDNDITREVVASDASNEQAINFAVDGDGIVTTLISYTGASDTRTRLKSFYRNATPLQMTEQTMQIELGKVGLNIDPKGIAYRTQTNAHTLNVVVNVNGLYADVFRGGIDFAVLQYKRNRGEHFTLHSVRQYGTDGDDIVSNVMLRDNLLYVFGKTNGQNFEGQPGSETNNGGFDGFIYAINVDNNSVEWARFIGSSDEDMVKDIDVGNRDLVALVSTRNTDEDAFIRRISSRTGVDQADDNPVIFSSPRDDKAVGIRFDSAANNFRALLNSSSLLSETNTPTPSLSQDAQLLSFSSDNASGGSIELSTTQDDEAITIENMLDNKHFVIGGSTFGAFPDNTKTGINTSDGFISIYDSQNLTNIKLTQFGTPGNDQVIAVKSVSSTKFLVLWKETFSSNAAGVYRISAFSKDGKKLSVDPN